MQPPFQPLANPLDLQGVFAQLARRGFHDNRLDEVLRQLTATTAQTLNIERVSLWGLCEQRQQLECIDLYELSHDRHSNGFKLHARHYPEYFRALSRGEPIVADDALKHPSTQEFLRDHLLMHGISALINSPIHADGELQGVLSIERVGEHSAWTSVQRLFVHAVASLVSLALLQHELLSREEELRDARNLREALFNGARDAILIADAGTGEIIDANPTAWQAYGLGSLAELQASDFWLAPPYSFAEALAWIRKAAAGGTQQFEWRNRRRTGESFWEQVTLSRITIGGVERILATAIDISERKQAEEKLAEYGDHLEVLVAERTGALAQAQEAIAEAQAANAAKTEFLSRMSHELRTPLNAILGFGQLLAMPGDAPLSAQQADNVQEILRAGRHLLDQVNEVLDLARIESGRIAICLEAVPLAPLAAECVALVRPLADARCIRIDSELDDSVVCADRARLKQVILNLLSNAIKYNREHGTVRLDACRQGDRLRLAVSDSGRGIASDHLPRLFQPFERLESSYDGIEGSGVGLALTKRLLEMMAGSIDVDSRIGVGSSFRCDLPLALPTTAAVAVTTRGTETAVAVAGDTTATATGGHARLRRVLHIDDNPANLKLVRKLLGEGSGIELSTADSGAAGLALALAVTPDLVLLDLDLPGEDGLATLRQLRAQPVTAAIPVIAITASAVRRDPDQDSRHGFTACLRKPLDPRNFRELVDRTLEREEDGGGRRRGRSDSAPIAAATSAASLR